MKRKNILRTAILAALAVIALLAAGWFARNDIQYLLPWPVARLLYPADGVFIEHENPLKQSHWIFDAGITDANSDGLLDIFTTNHNWRQHLLLADGSGSYREALTDWGLDQSHEFPGMEISTTPPVIDKAGIYIYWYNRHLYVHSYNLPGNADTVVRLHALTEVRILNNDGFEVSDKRCNVITAPLITECTITLSPSSNGSIELYPRSRGVPMNFYVKGSVAPKNIYVGNQRISPVSRRFSLPLQDRHAMVWSDYNDDGQPDVFITRGAIGGTLRIFPPEITNSVDEEFFVSRKSDAATTPRFDNIIADTGISKDGCSARHANWVDINTDGLLDLFINCEDVGNVEGEYPNKLYLRDTDGKFTETAVRSGLGVPGHNIIDYEWLDADNDGDMDLFAHQDDGYYLYRNREGQFETEFIHRGEFARIDHPELKGESGAYWIFDGKLSVADYDNDGDLDVFSASKKGNALLVNHAGTFSPLDPLTLGLPANSVSASWVDYDNDGLTDLHSVPDGIYRQDSDHDFEQTFLLLMPDSKYMASIINWYDLDNDGTRDALVALNENPTLHRWWERGEKDTFKWLFHTWRNTANHNHWLQVRLKGTAGNREAIGARVTLVTPDGRQMQEVGISDGAFYSQGHYRLYFGLGPHDRADSVIIRWPDGEQQKLEDVTANTLLVVERGIQ
jgi:hypothetical protein